MKKKRGVPKLVLLHGGIETLGYFSERLADSFRKMGFPVFLHLLDEADLPYEGESYQKLIRFCKDGQEEPIFLITFNFLGLCGDGAVTAPDGQNFFLKGKAGIRCFCLNIMVDHPFYYQEFLLDMPENFFLYCIDQGHLSYVKRFHKELKGRSGFLPLGGTSLGTGYGKHFSERKMDLVFVGNYTPPEKFCSYIERLNDEYSVFYYHIIEELVHNPFRSMEEVMEENLRREIPGISENECRDAMAHMIFIDLYVRFYYRGLVVKTLAEAGFSIHLYGKGWDLLSCGKKENLVLCGPTDSEGCLLAMREAKISLNVMPWFKQGAHDRVFNAILNGAVCLTDGSTYLKEFFGTKQEKVLFYDLGHLEELEGIIHALLKEGKRAGQIQESAYQSVKNVHDWEARAGVLAEKILMQYKIMQKEGLYK